MYATQLGIGGYSLGGLSVNVFTAPLAHTFRLGKDGSWKLKVRLPINLGIYTFNATEANGTKVSTDQQTLSLIPGPQLDIPVADNWTLKPFGDFGFGHSLNSGGSYYCPARMACLPSIGGTAAEYPSAIPSSAVSCWA